MNWTPALWLTVAMLTIVALVLLRLSVFRNRPIRSSPAVRAAWLAGATTSGTVLVFIAAKVIDRLPNATAIDIAAVAITGILTGIFLALGLSPTQTTEMRD